MSLQETNERKMSRFRILSIDGGGIKGVFPASFLATVEEKLGEPIQSYFDLISGTSTGGIIALGLGFGHSAQKLLDFYVKRGPEIFPARARTFTGALKTLFHGYKYDPMALRTALTDVFGDSTLADAQSRLVIPTLNAASGKIHIYKTPHHPKLEMDHCAKAVDVALATSAAPVYLPSHVSPEGIPFLDGGLFQNNPTGMAVVEAITMLGIDRHNIEVLSIGCTEEPKNFTKIGHAVGWGLAAIEAAMSGQSFSSLGTAYLLAGHEHVLRINPSVAPGRFRLDDPKGIDELRAFGYQEAREAIPELRKRFLGDHAEPFRPLHGARRQEIES